jgi:hypothetical protein
LSFNIYTAVLLTILNTPFTRSLFVTKKMSVKMWCGTMLYGQSGNFGMLS